MLRVKATYVELLYCRWGSIIFLFVPVTGVLSFFPVTHAGGIFSSLHYINSIRELDTIPTQQYQQYPPPHKIYISGELYK